MQYLLRNKIIALLLVLQCGLLNSTHAQYRFRSELNMEDHDEKPIRFGINLGMNRSSYNIDHSSRFLNFDSINVIESINNTGINLAWLVNLRLGKHLDIRTYPLNLVFTEKAFEYKLISPDPYFGEKSTEIRKVQGIAMALPIQLKFTSDRINNLKVFLMTGFRFDYDLAANANKKNTDETITLKKLDYGLEAAIGFHIYFPVFVLTPEIKTSYGFKNVIARKNDFKYSNVIDRITSRSITFSLTVE
jgi:Outer membrane protein beta-barrel domain